MLKLIPGPGLRLIPGSGPDHARGMLVGEAGGETEHHQQRPFAGKSGRVLTAYCLAAGLPRPNLYITNIYPYWTGPGNPDPTPEQIHSQQWRLEADIERIKPRVIGAVGRIATRWFLGDVDMDVTHGVPYWSDRAPGAIIVPIYHPAAGFYDPDLAAFSQDDVMRFAHYLGNPVDVRRAPEFEFVLHEDAPEFIEGAVDTEGIEDKPWGASWCVDGRVCHVWIWKPGQRTPRLRGFIEFHNALYDLKILRSMGISTQGLRYGDTMLRLFNLQLEPQALKSAAYRHLGLKMGHFDETVRPHFDALALRWLKRAAAAEYAKPWPVAVQDYAKKKNRIYKPQGVGRRIKNLLRSYRKEQNWRLFGIVPDKPVKLEKRWEKIGENAYSDETEPYQSLATRAVGEPFPEFSIFCVPTDQAVEYSGTDAGATSALVPKLDTLIDAKGLRSVYNMDRRALPFVDRMQECGMRVDVKGMREFEADLEVIREQTRRRVQQVTGYRWFNPGSADQVARWLYSSQGLPVMTYTESGRGSTADSALKMLRGYHAQDPDVAEFIDALQDYREADKYLGTFVGPIFDYLKRDAEGFWRLHANFRVTRVVSGRLSSFDPNVLALPARTKLGRRIRTYFVARPGWILVDCDLSQAELRVGAHFSRDPRMREAFETGVDLHSLTTSLIFHIAIELVEKDSPERYASKIVNFAVFYGISAKALLEQLYKADVFTFTLEDCEKFIREWFRIYGSVRTFQEKLWRQAAIDGFVRDMWGRICYVPNLRVMDDKLKESAQRLAANMPIQSTVSGLIKRAETRVHDYIEEGGLRDVIWPWLQMHDELLLEARLDVADEMKRDLGLMMTADQSRLSVPIKADAKTGASWGSAKG